MKSAILVPEVQTRAQLAAVRSLGRAGYRVHAVSSNPNAMGFRSNFVQQICVHPPYKSLEFIPWLTKYCADQDIKMIVPSGGFLGAIRENFEQFKHLLPLSQDQSVVYRGGDKISAFKCWSDAGLLNNHPKTIIGTIENRPDFESLPLPIYIKGGRGADGEIVGEGFFQCSSSGEASAAFESMISAGYGSALIQGGVVGRQIGVSLMMGPEGPLAGNVVVDCHSEPHSKGTMSLRRTEWLQDVYDDAVQRLKAMRWIGCAMVEYRRDDVTGDFNVIEVNARFWQYLHLDIHAGVDFPKLLAEWFIEGKIPPASQPISGVVCRDTFPGEVAQLINALRKNPKDFSSALGFIFRSFDPRIFSDLNFKGDRSIYFIELLKFIKSEIKNNRRHNKRTPRQQ